MDCFLRYQQKDGIVDENVVHAIPLSFCKTCELNVFVRDPDRILVAIIISTVASSAAPYTVLSLCSVRSVSIRTGGLMLPTWQLRHCMVKR